jgi:hypothetical protein
MLQDHGVTAIQAAQVQECEWVARLANMAHNTRFYINDTVIENVTKFKYLGWIISVDDYNKQQCIQLQYYQSFQNVVPHEPNSQLGYSW